MLKRIIFKFLNSLHMANKSAPANSDDYQSELPPNDGSSNISIFKEGKTVSPGELDPHYGKKLFISMDLLSLKEKRLKTYYQLLGLMTSNPIAVLEHPELANYWSRFSGITDEDIRAIGEAILERESAAAITWLQEFRGADLDGLPSAYQDFVVELSSFFKENREKFHALLNLIQKAIDGESLDANEERELPGENRDHLNRILRKFVEDALWKQDDEDSDDEESTD